MLVPAFSKFLGCQKQRLAPRYLVLWPSCQLNGPRTEQLFNLGHPLYHRVFLVSCGQRKHTVLQSCEVRRHFTPVAEVHLFTRERDLERTTDRPSVRQDLTLAEELQDRREGALFDAGVAQDYLHLLPQTPPLNR